MPRTALTVQQMAAYGGGKDDFAWTSGDATNDHEFLNNGKCFLLMKNADASPHPATVVGVASPRTFNQQPDVTITCAAGKECMFGPFDQTAFNQTNGKIHVDLADDTSVSFAVLEYTPTPSG